MQVFQHKKHPEFRVVLKKLSSYKSGIYIRVDENNNPMQRKKAFSKGFEEYDLLIKHENLELINELDR